MSGEEDRIGVFVVAGTRLYREGVARALGQFGRLCVLGMAGDVPTAIEAIGKLVSRPDVVLLDHALPEGAGAARQLRETFPGLRVVAVAVGEAEDDVIPWAEAGAIGFIPRDASLDDLVVGVVAVADGCGFCSPRVTAVLLRRMASMAESRCPASKLSGLTAREREVALLLAKGLSNKEIARSLKIQLATVKNHVHNVLEKLEVRRRGEAASVLRTGDGSTPGGSTI